MLARLELIGGSKYRLRGPHRVATDLMEIFKFVRISFFFYSFIRTNLSIMRNVISEFFWIKKQTTPDEFLGTHTLAEQKIDNVPANARLRRNMPSKRLFAEYERLICGKAAMIERWPFQVEPCAWHSSRLLLHQNVVSTASSAGLSLHCISTQVCELARTF